MTPTKEAIAGTEWPALKRAIWDVVVSEELNGTDYINAWEFTDKLYTAALAAMPGPVVPDLGQEVRQNYNCPCIHPSQCDNSCFTPATDLQAAPVVFASKHNDETGECDPVEAPTPMLKSLERSTDLQAENERLRDALEVIRDDEKLMRPEIRAIARAALERKP